MRVFFAILLSAVALLAAPIVDQACGDRSFRPDLLLAPLVICVSLCPGAPAVVCCGVLGLILDCLAGPHLGARAACFCLLAAVASLISGDRDQSWGRRLVGWWALLSVAGVLSQLLARSSVGSDLHVATVGREAIFPAITTALLLAAGWLVVPMLWTSRRTSRSGSRFAPVIGRMAGGD